LLDRLRQAIGAAQRNKTQLAILFVDLDRFKNINDSMGHSIGDKLLQEVAQRLQKSIRSIDTISRQGGDEFLVMLADIGTIPQVAHIADNVMKAIALPYQIDAYELTVTASIGISIYPGDGDEIETLIKHADVAMYHAKGSGRNRYQFFSRQMNARIVERMELESSLKKAIHRTEFILQYQPEVDFANDRVVGAEALIRWQHPQLGLAAAVSFHTGCRRMRVDCADRRLGAADRMPAGKIMDGPWLSASRLGQSFGSAIPSEKFAEQHSRRIEVLRAQSAVSGAGNYGRHPGR